MLKVCCLGSGSQGNSTYIYIDGHHYLVDCGFTKPGLQKRLDTINRDVSDIEKVFVTHDHKDHVKPWILNEHLVFKQFMPEKPEGISIFPLSHDTPCVGYTFTDSDGHKVGLVTDTGYIPEEALKHLLGCSILLIECNYNIEELIDCPYPIERQERIASEQGHLRDECAIETIRTVAGPELEHLIAIHLSSSNINPSLLGFELKTIPELPKGCKVHISSQRKPTEMMVVM